MRLSHMSLVMALLVVPAIASAAEANKVEAAAEAKLAEALKGRVPGAPVDCITMHEIRSSRIFNKTAILYEMNNGTYYLNRPKVGVSSLHWGDVLVTDTHSSQLCSIDVIKLYDSGTRMQSGFVGLDKFVPYTKPKGHDHH